jgi:CRISPR/Cas system-associated exonuclease Cas4 (RecB family)
MAKKTSKSSIITTLIHEDLRSFSRKMVNDYYIVKKEVSNNKIIDGKVVKDTISIKTDEIVRDKYQTVTMPLLVKDTSNPKAIITTINSDTVYLSNQKISLSDEALLYLVHLAGHPKNVFLYILYYLINEETLEFRTDSLVQHYYMEFCKVTGYKVSSSAMKDAIKKLGEMRLIINVARNRYMMNPIVLGFKNNVIRNNAFTLYINKLAEKGKYIENYLLPHISILKK